MKSVVQLRKAAEAMRERSSGTKGDVGPAVADWLEEVAALVGSYPHLDRRHFDGESCSDHACRIAHAALAVARIVNGGAE